MEKEIQKVVVAFKAGKALAMKMVKTDGKAVWINGKKIAWYEADGSVSAMLGGFA